MEVNLIFYPDELNVYHTCKNSLIVLICPNDFLAAVM